jgi:hypothetical protein
MPQNYNEVFAGSPNSTPDRQAAASMVVPAGSFAIDSNSVLKHGMDFLRALYANRLDLAENPTAAPLPEAFAGGGVVELAGGGKIAIGPGGGLDDLIPTSIDGRRAAALSDGEFVIPADVVSMMGDGSSNAGARRLYDLVKQVRQEKTGSNRQAGPLPVGEILKRSVGR